MKTIDYLIVLLASCCFGALSAMLAAPLWASVPAGLIFGSVVGKQVAALRIRREKEKGTP